MSKLEAAGFIEVEKQFVDKKLHTMLHLTLQGRKAFEVYRRHMRQLFAGG